MYSSLAVQLNDSVEKWPIVSTSYDEVYERLTYKLKDPLPTEAKATLVIRFTGDLTESRAGYYRSTWAHDGIVEHYSLTKFEVQLNAHFESLRIISLKKNCRPFQRAKLFPAGTSLRSKQLLISP